MSSWNLRFQPFAQRRLIQSNALKLGFEEEQAVYESPSQNIRAMTETWAKNWLFCPNCGNQTLDKLPNNRPAADLACPKCQEEFELKSQRAKFGKKVLDGAYDALIKRLASANNPNFFFLNYSSRALKVENLIVVPKHFFTTDIIEKRKPLSPTARRAGWTGCNILLDSVPNAGKIFIVKQSVPEPRDSVIASWQETLFLRKEEPDARGWLLDVMRCVDNLEKPEFELAEVYAFENYLSAIYPNNSNVRPKIRQQLQRLRDVGYLDFISRGRYRLKSHRL